MAELKNERDEKLAQGIAAGLSYVEAAKAAGMSGDRGNSSKSARRPVIRARVVEIRAGMPQPDPVPVPSAAATPSDTLAALRDQAATARQFSASVSAEKERRRLEREERKAREHAPNMMAVAQALLPALRRALVKGQSAEELICAWLGIVDPAQRLALGVPVSNPKRNGASPT